MSNSVEKLLQKGLELHQIGQTEFASQIYKSILTVQPHQPEANYKMGLLAVGSGEMQAGLAFLETALEANADNALYWISYIDTLHQIGRIEDAQAIFNQAKNNGAKGEGFDQLEQRLKALDQEPLEASGAASLAHQNQPNVLESLKLDQALRLAKKKAKEGSLAEAKRIYQDVLVKFPKNKKAIDGVKALAGGPVGKAFKVQDPPQYQLQSLIDLYSQGLLQQALEQATVLLQKFPSSGVLYNISGAAYKGLGQFDAAVEAYSKALAIEPENAQFYSHMGVVLQDQGKLEEAIEAYNKALAIKPDYAEAYNNMGNALKEQGKLEEAIEAYNKTLTIKPDYAEAYYNIGITLKEQGKLEEAIEAYNKALAIKPDYEVVRASKLHQQAHICDWDSIAKDIELIRRLGTIEGYVSPFALLSLEDDPEGHRIRSELYAEAKYPHKSMSTWVKPVQKPRRLKIGYFSADFHNHATMYLMAQVFATHNHEHFEVYAFSYGPDKRDEMRHKLIANVDKFYDVRNMSDAEIIELAKATNLDIAVDLKGYTKDHRLSLFSSRLAPVQISYLGYPGTLGADFIDYIVADQTLIPEDKRRYYTEQIIYLPYTYQPTDNKRRISSKIVTRQDVGLPSDAFVFCCFNQNYKISPKEFDIWMRLLSKVEGSVLWLLRSNKWTENNLKQQAEALGINSKRLVFADKIPQAEHIARQKLADLFLDTFNVNAHTTTSDALWAGLPVVTKMGQGFAARVAGSLLNAIGLPELVTTTKQDYEELILELATNPTRLAKVKEKLATNRLNQPLFNTELYTSHLESGYQQAYQNYFDGNPPQTITVQG
jgi:predicted O-linked N-acetylglucosamine transferase (SPINDLY family)